MKDNNPTSHASNLASTRRDFLKLAGLAAAGATLAAAGGLAPAVQAALPAKPNILLILTDQERYPQHWPAGWAEANLPNHKRLADKGLTLQRMFCNTSMCSPSRATLFTGLYPAQHGLERTGTPDYQLPSSIQTMAKMLASAGYNVQLRGKWHMSYDNSANPPTYPPTADQVAAYGFNGWLPTNAGDGTEVTGFGEGCAQNDAQIAQQAVNFLQSSEATSGTTPFALIVTLVNPHDVLAYPNTWDDDTCGGDEYASTANFSQGILLSDTASYGEDLSTKPSAQAESKALFATGLGVIGQPPSLQPRDYINFYADLHKKVDARLGQILNALTPTLLNNTLIVYTSDHGEMGLAHGGLRQKMYNAYEETMHIPMIISNPQLFPDPLTTTALASLVDLMPTLASVASVPNRSKWHFSGFDLSPLFSNPAGSVQDAVLFTFDDEDAGQSTPPPAGLAVNQPNHIRCIREANWKYARYFDPSGVEGEQYELYDLVSDPNELSNLAGKPANKNDQDRLAAKLAQIEEARLNWHSYLPAVTR
jgi:choline-sulfatase